MTTEPNTLQRDDIIERNIARLLESAYSPEMPDADFAARVAERMRDAAVRRPRTIRLWPTATGLAALLALAAGLAVYVSPLLDQPSAEMSTASAPGSVQAGEFGPGRIARAPADAPPVGLTAMARPAADPPQVARVGQTLTTGPRQRRRVALADGSLLMLNANTSARVTGHRRVDLTAGEMFVDVAPLSGPRLAGDATFTVATPQRSVTAHGTQFVVRVAPAGTSVAVVQGTVRVSDYAGDIDAGRQLAAGASSTSGLPRASVLLDWTRDLTAAADAPLVPASQYGGGAVVAKLDDGQEVRLSLRRCHVDVHIEDGFARTTIDQVYFNHLPQRLEGTFYFPLPADASLSRLAMYVNGRLMEGGMAERARARSVYEQIKASMKDPALLEWVDGTTFRMRVFPLEGRQEKRILISYTQRLDSAYGQQAYRFPVGHSLGQVGTWSFTARVAEAAGTPWQCDTYPLDAVNDGNDLLLQFAADRFEPADDVAIRLTPPPAPAGAQFASCEHETGSYFMVRHTPSLPRAKREGRRNWLIMFESSADRDPLLARTQVEIARAVLGRAEHDDRFAVMAVGTRVRMISDGWQDATKANVADAIARLERTHLVGALDLAAGLMGARALVAEADGRVHLLHLGSGVPVLGMRKDLDLLGLLTADPIGTRTIYVGVGVGRRWNRDFMKLTALVTGGWVTQMNPDEPVAWRAAELLDVLQSPRLIGLQAAAVTDRDLFNKLSADPAVYADQALADSMPMLTFADSAAAGGEIAAAVRLATPTTQPDTPRVYGVVLTARLGGRPWHAVLPVTAVRPNAGYLPRQWARLEINRLLAASPVDQPRVVELSKQMYVMSPFTSLLVLENEAMYQQYQVDRGRKDHWALYPAPETIEVVHEPIAPPAVIDPPAPTPPTGPEVGPSTPTPAPPPATTRPADARPSPASLLWTIVDRPAAPLLTLSPGTVRDPDTRTIAQSLGLDRVVRVHASSGPIIGECYVMGNKVTQSPPNDGGNRLHAFGRPGRYSISDDGFPLTKALELVGGVSTNELYFWDKQSQRWEWRGQQDNHPGPGYRSDPSFAARFYDEDDDRNAPLTLPIGFDLNGGTRSRVVPYELSDSYEKSPHDRRMGMKYLSLPQTPRGREVNDLGGWNITPLDEPWDFPLMRTSLEFNFWPQLYTRDGDKNWHLYMYLPESDRRRDERADFDDWQHITNPPAEGREGTDRPSNQFFYRLGFEKDARLRGIPLAYWPARQGGASGDAVNINSSSPQVMQELNRYYRSLAGPAETPSAVTPQTYIPSQPDLGAADIPHQQIDLERIRWERSVAAVNNLAEQARATINKPEDELQVGDFAKARRLIQQAGNVLKSNENVAVPGQYRTLGKNINDLGAFIDAKESTWNLEQVRMQRDAAARQQRDRLDREARARQRRIDELLQKARSARQEREYGVTMELTREVLELDPRHREARWLYEDTETADVLQRRENINQRKDIEFRNTLLNVRDALTPYDDPMTYPSADVWHALTEQRQRWAAGLPPEPPANVRTRGLMQKSIPEIRFQAIEFENAINFLRDLQRVNINPNWIAMEQLGITKLTEVTLQLRDVTFETALRELLNKVAGREEILDYVIRDGVIKISTREELSTIQYILVYDIRDLTARVNGERVADSLRAAILSQNRSAAENGSITETDGLLIARLSVFGHREMQRAVAAMQGGPVTWVGGMDVTMPPGLLYRRPSLARSPRVFDDLLAWAPGMRTTPADVATIIEAEGRVRRPEIGRIDPLARKMIERARSLGWQKVMLPPAAGQREGATVLCDGRGRMVVTRRTPAGLAERIVADGRHVFHIYDELGVATRRPMSRHHAAELRGLVPWLVPSVEELAAGADLVPVGPHSVAAVPVWVRKIERPTTAPATQPEEVPHLRLVMIFDEVGRLAERQLMDHPSGQVLARASYSPRGLVEVFDADGNRAGSAVLGVAEASEPNLTIDANLVVLPMPARTPEHVAGMHDLAGRADYPNWSEDAAMEMIVARLLAGVDPWEIVKARFADRGDRRRGWATALLSSKHAFTDASAKTIRGTDPLSRYIWARHELVADGTAPKAPVQGPTDHFLVRLSSAEWLTRQLTDLPEPDNRDRVMVSAEAFVRREAPSPLAWAVLDAMLTSNNDALGRAGVELAELFGDAPDLSVFARYERARALHNADRQAEACQAWAEWYRNALASGVLPPVDGQFARAMQQAHGGDNLSHLVADPSRRLRAAGRRTSLVALAWQMHALGAAGEAEQALAAADIDGTGYEPHPAHLAAVHYLWSTGRLGRADRIVADLTNGPLQRWPALWRAGAELSHQRGRVGESINRLERAIELEHAALGERLTLAQLRADLGQLLGRCVELSTSISGLSDEPPDVLVARVIDAADRWRACDPDPTPACRAAADALRRLGKRELAWEYLTTPLADARGEPGRWSSLADRLAESGEAELAQRAMAVAADLEPSDPTLLLRRAALLRRAGNDREAEQVYRDIVETEWRDEFRSTIDQARQLMHAN